MLWSAQYRRIAAISSSSPGSSTASGASWTPESLRRNRSSVDLPPARSSRARSSTPQYSAPTIVANPSRSAGDSADGRSLTCSASSSAVDDFFEADRLLEQRSNALRQRFRLRGVAPCVPLHRGQECGLLVIRTRSCVTVLHMLSMSNDRSSTIGDRILEAAAYCVHRLRGRPGDIGRDRAPRAGEQADGLSALAGHPVGACGTADHADRRRIGRGAEPWDRPRGAGRAGRRGRRSLAQRRSGHVGAAQGSRVDDGLHHRAAGHQPADPHRHVGGRHQARPGRGQRAARRTASARGDVSADRPVDDPVRADRRPDPRRRRARRRTRPLR